MTVRELAKIFRMNINELSAFSGYSKQGLYDLLSRKTNINKKRFNVFLENLLHTSYTYYEVDTEMAQIDKIKREKAIMELKELVKEDTENANPAN